MARLTRIAPELPVTDLTASIAYYEHKLGFEVVMVMAGEYAVVERDDAAVHLFANGTGKAGPVSIHIFTEGLDELHAELQQRGAKIAQGIEEKPWGNRDFRVLDPSTNEIKFSEASVDDE